MTHRAPKSPTDVRPSYTAEELANSYANRVQRHLEMLNACAENVKRETTNACQQVHRAAIEMKNNLAVREKHFIDQLKKHEAEILQKLDSAYREAEAVSTNSLCCHVTGLQLSDLGGSPVTGGDAQERLSILETTSLKGVLWTTRFYKKEMPSATVIDALLGTLYTSHRMMNTSIVDACDVDFSCSGHLRGVEKVDLGDPLLTLEPGLSPENVSGIAMIGDCLCVLENDLWMFNVKSKKQKKHPKTGAMAFVKFTSMTSLGCDCLVVTDNNGTLYILSVNPETMEITPHRTAPVPFKDFTVTADAVSGKLVFTNPSELQIFVYDPEADRTSDPLTVSPKVNPKDGQVWVCDTSFPDLEGTLKKPKAAINMDYAIICKGGYALLGRDLASTDDTIYWLDQEGAVVDTTLVASHTSRYRMYPRPDSAGPMINDRHGRLLVVSKEHGNILLFGSDRKFLQRVISNVRPVHVCLEEVRGRLAVACTDDVGAEKLKLRVYEWPAA